MNNINKAKFRQIVSNFTKTKILVVGDLILDEFIWGEVSRISPEAPVPIVWVNSESFMPGGAANVANNIQSLGGGADVVGVIGADNNGVILKEALAKKGINVSGIISDSTRPTIVKTRVIAHHQQVVRIDREKTEPIENVVVDNILSYIRKRIDSVNALIIEDYGKGVILPRLLQELLPLSKKYNRIVVVDPKEEHFSYYQGVTLITPNHHEAECATGIKITDRESLEQAGRNLMDELGCRAVLITRGEDGMALFEGNGRVTHISTVAQDVFDVSGAGDTVAGVLTLALASGANMVEAAHISNYAAGVVVGKVGIAVVTPEELLDKVENSNSHIKIKNI
jgi:D-beta-D-heptose 7-phosphate kinase/D-beta-D-heptose 1-phosphate adenosyltransferase